MKFKKASIRPDCHRWLKWMGSFSLLFFSLGRFQMKSTGLYWNKRNWLCETGRPEKWHTPASTAFCKTQVTVDDEGLCWLAWEACAILTEEIIKTLWNISCHLTDDSVSLLLSDTLTFTLSKPSASATLKSTKKNKLTRNYVYNTHRWLFRIN